MMIIILKLIIIILIIIIINNNINPYITYINNKLNNFSKNEEIEQNKENLSYISYLENKLKKQKFLFDELQNLFYLCYDKLIKSTEINKNLTNEISYLKKEIKNLKKTNEKQKFINENNIKGKEIENDISTINYIQQTLKNIQKLEPKTLSNKNNNLNTKNIPKPKKTLIKNLNKEISIFLQKNTLKNSQYENDLNTLKSQLNII